MHGARTVAFRVVPPQIESLWVINMDSNLLGKCVEFHVGNLPWSSKADDLLVAFFGLHMGFHSEATQHLPLKTRMACF